MSHTHLLSIFCKLLLNSFQDVKFPYKTYKLTYKLEPDETTKVQKYCEVLRELVPFEQFEKMKNTHGGVLLLLKL